MGYFIINPTNMDYLIPRLRFIIGDTDTDNPTYSDSFMRSALIHGIEFLQFYWQNRYLIYDDGMVVRTLPAGYAYAGSPEAETASTVIPAGYLYGKTPEGYTTNLPSGLLPNDVLRNPAMTFSEPSVPTDPDYRPIVQSDIAPVLLAARLNFLKAQWGTSLNTTGYMSWSDGEFTMSNIQSAKTAESLYNAEKSELDMYFRTNLTAGIRSDYRRKVITRY